MRVYNPSMREMWQSDQELEANQVMRWSVDSVFLGSLVERCLQQHLLSGLEIHPSVLGSNLSLCVSAGWKAIKAQPFALTEDGSVSGAAQTIAEPGL